MSKKSFNGFFQLEKTKTRFFLSSIFNDLQPLKMAACPCTAAGCRTTGIFQPPVKHRGISKNCHPGNFSLRKPKMRFPVCLIFNRLRDRKWRDFLVPHGRLEFFEVPTGLSRRVSTTPGNSSFATAAEKEVMKRNARAAHDSDGFSMIDFRRSEWSFTYFRSAALLERHPRGKRESLFVLLGISKNCHPGNDLQADE